MSFSEFDALLTQYGFSPTVRSLLLGVIVGGSSVLYLCKRHLEIHHSSLDAQGKLVTAYRGQIADYKRLNADLKRSTRQKDEALKQLVKHSVSRELQLRWAIKSWQVKVLHNQLLVEAFGRLHVYAGMRVPKQVVGAPSVFELFKKLDALNEALYGQLEKCTQAVDKLVEGGSVPDRLLNEVRNAPDLSPEINQVWNTMDTFEKKLRRKTERA